ncbi:hypothetical protein C4K08_4388 [Pseudomonas chlororaphis subsp. aureofaciens]|nr:hypothetical protein C4K08_4388 [Pseudomonas chlororaphis subsp. aureofaciens]
MPARSVLLIKVGPPRSFLLGALLLLCVVFMVSAMPVAPGMEARETVEVSNTRSVPAYK